MHYLSDYVAQPAQRPPSHPRVSCGSMVTGASELASVIGPFNPNWSEFIPKWSNLVGGFFSGYFSSFLLTLGGLFVCFSLFCEGKEGIPCWKKLIFNDSLILASHSR